MVHGAQDGLKEQFNILGNMLIYNVVDGGEYLYHSSIRFIR